MKISERLESANQPIKVEAKTSRSTVVKLFEIVKRYATEYEVKVNLRKN